MATPSLGYFLPCFIGQQCVELFAGIQRKDLPVVRAIAVYSVLMISLTGG